jgi:class 3 adenylate cyclase
MMMTGIMEPGMQHTRLAAIMFTDIVGYSRLMEEDEQRTIEILQQHNRIVLAVIAEGGGEVVDAIGDGLLVIYRSAFDAVQSALQIHTAVSEYNAGAEERMRFLLRIGIHLGDIWQEDDRVYGNGVNVAARVQPHAPAGGIAVTEDVYTQIVNKLAARIEPIGRPTLKNISRSIMLYRVVSGTEEPVSDEQRSFTGSAENGGGETLDAIKERLLAEKLKISESRENSSRRRGRAEQRFGSMIENSVYGLVEGIMDRAIEKWEQMPAESKAEAARALRNEESPEGRQNHHVQEHEQGPDQEGPNQKGPDQKGPRAFTINLTDGTDDDLPDKRDEEQEGSGTSDLSLGLVMIVGFALGTFYFNVGWMIWPLVMLGVLPTVSGLYKVVRNRLRRRREARERPRKLEQEILRVAREYGGRVTVVQVAARTDASLDEVQETLDGMTSKGYVSQHILDSGVIQYEFPSMT